MQKVMNISIAVNERYARYAYVMLTSLFENHREQSIHVYVLFGDMCERLLQELYSLGERYGQKIHAVRMDMEQFPDQLPRNHEWTIEVYYRLALADVLPAEVKRILYLDVDIVIIDSIWEFYNTDFAGKSLCACPDMSAADGLPEKQSRIFQDFINEPDFQYFNSGVLLMNVEKIRRNFSLKQFLNLAMKLPLVSPDQDLLNYVFYKDIVFENEERYNLFAKLSYCMGHGCNWVKEHTAIIHYTGFKPWSYEALHYDTEKFWWDYAKKTPFYVGLLEDIVLNEVNSSCMDKLVRGIEKEKNEMSVTLNKCLAIIRKLKELT